MADLVDCGFHEQVAGFRTAGKRSGEFITPHRKPAARNWRTAKLAPVPSLRNH